VEKNCQRFFLLTRSVAVAKTADHTACDVRYTIIHVAAELNWVFFIAYAAELVEPSYGIFTSEWRAWSPPGNFVSGHSLTICDIVCLLPQAQSGSSRMSNTCREAAQIPWPVRYQLSIVQSLRLRLNPGWQEVGSVIKNWLGIFCLALSLPSKPHVQTRQSWALRTISDVWTIIEDRDDQKCHRTLGRLGRSRIYNAAMSIYNCTIINVYFFVSLYFYTVYINVRTFSCYSCCVLSVWKARIIVHFRLRPAATGATTVATTVTTSNPSPGNMSSTFKQLMSLDPVSLSLDSSSNISVTTNSVFINVYTPF